MLEIKPMIHRPFFMPLSLVVGLVVAMLLGASPVTQAWAQTDTTTGGGTQPPVSQTDLERVNTITQGAVDIATQAEQALTNLDNNPTAGGSAPAVNPIMDSSNGAPPVGSTGATGSSADICDANGPWNRGFASTQANMAGRLVSVHRDFLDNAPTLDAGHYCTQNLINVIKGIRMAMIGFDLKFAFMELIMGAIVEAIINAACSFVQSLVTQIQTLKNSMALSVCLPLPQLRLGLNIPRPRFPCIGFGGTALGQVSLTAVPRKTPSSANPIASPTPTQSRWDFNVWGGTARHPVTTP
jgi:hypothetical protein